MRGKSRLKLKSMPKKLIILAVSTIILSNCLAQGKLSVGFDLVSRNERRSYNDPKGYLHRQYAPLFAIGGSLNYTLNEKWEIETGIYNTSFRQTISAYYKEPGFIPLSRTGWQVNGLKTLIIPFRGIYNFDLRWKSISFAAVAGINLYTLTGSLDSRGEAGLSAIPVYPTPPTNLMIYYESYPVRKNSLALEYGGEVRLPISNRLFFIYRFTVLNGTKEMHRMEGYYETDNPRMRYDFEVSSKGSSIHNTFSIRYRLGKKKEKDNWWECED